MFLATSFLVVVIVSVGRLCFVSPVEAAAAVPSLGIFVDPIAGSDVTNDGLSPEFAFRTIHRAADALATSPASQGSTRIVQLVAGTYWINQSLHLSQEHSNTIWRTYTPERIKANAYSPSWNGSERLTRVLANNVDADASRRFAHIRGGCRINPSSFRRCRKNSNILVAPIPAQVGDLGKIQSGDLGQCANSKAEVYFNGQQLILARYPNMRSDNQWTWDTIANVTSNVTFMFNGDRPLRRRYDKAPDLWLHGYWNFDWADNYVAAKVNTKEKSYTIDTEHSHILYELTNGARYYVFNLLQELDVPGEYYIDRKRRLLYMYPPVPKIADSEIVVSTIENLVRADHLTDTSFVDIHWSTSRGTGLNFSSPARVKVVGGSISNVGGAEALLLENATDCHVQNVTISDCDCGGINVTGGNRQTLTASKTTISHNYINFFAKWKRTYMAGILFDGCGHIVSNNVVANAPHTGITGRCNDCVFSNNNLHDLCYVSDVATSSQQTDI